MSTISWHWLPFCLVLIGLTTSCREDELPIGVTTDLDCDDPLFDDTDGNVTLCHLPPGNADNAHTIRVGARAVETHLTHHDDRLGPCDCTPGECEIEFPLLDDPVDDTGTLGTAAPEISTDALVAHWSLDGTWDDAWGGFHMEPFREGGFAAADYARGGDNQSYGPTGATVDNGAVAPTLTDVPIGNGLTLEGWYYNANNNTTGVLFGFGNNTWGEPNLTVLDSWGTLVVLTGEKLDRVMVRYARPEVGCWHHLAVVLPPGFDTGVPIQVYLDGEEIQSIDGSNTVGGIGLMGSPFEIGTFTLPNAGQMRMDEVRLWERPLTPDEVAIAATPTGNGVQCPGVFLDWEPGPRCTWDENEGTPVVAMDGEVRVLTDDTIMVISDPTPWLLGQLDGACGEYLLAMEENIDEVDGWWFGFQYQYAWLETKARYWPQFIDALWATDHFLVASCDDAAVEPVTTTHWPQAVREISVPRPGLDAQQKLTRAEVIWVSYLDLPFQLQSGEPYAVRDAWGNRLDFTYDEDETISWAIKVNQLGYLPDAPSKYAYLGAWASQAGALDLSRFDGAPFAVVDAVSGSTMSEGTIEFRMDDTDLSGEMVYQMDFSDFTTPGEYYIRVPGAGRSWEFTIGQEAIGEAFYTHAGGMYHNRCGTDLEMPYTAWTRGDIHQTYRGGFPPDADDYRDHSQDGWGFLDESDNFVPYSSFGAVAATATDELLADVNGGWHDAGDFDRRPYHFLAVQDLVLSYLMFPDNFTDGQLGLPEDQNGIPDILDEARWGVDVWMAAQEDSGGVGTWIEATSHPLEWDPGQDSQRYYLSLATRNSSLEYARYAAMLGRALTLSGHPAEGEPFIESAAAAYAFGTDDTIRVSNSWAVDGEIHSWTEPPEPDEERQLWALVELWLATGDPAFEAELQTPEMDAEFYSAVRQLWWKNRIYMAVDVALEGDSFSAGWGEEAEAAVVWRADQWLAAYDTHAYRRVWYRRDHGYFGLAGWGNNLYMPLRALVAAWRLTGDEQYREAALLGLDYLHGANGQGRVGTTGLGDHGASVALDLPSWSDDIDELSPGITIYGSLTGVPWVGRTHVYGLQAGNRGSPSFEGVEMALMPPPYDNSMLTLDDVGAELYAILPQWRRLVPLEQNVVPSMEFAVWETISPAASVSGCLMGPGWEPGANLLDRQPRTEEELRSSLWMIP